MFPERPARQNQSREGEHPSFNRAALYTTTCELRKMEQQLQEIEERFHALATVSGQIVWTARPDGMSYDAPFWRAYTGQSRTDVEGLGWMEAIHPEDRERTSRD